MTYELYATKQFTVEMLLMGLSLPLIKNSSYITVAPNILLYRFHAFDDTLLQELSEDSFNPLRSSFLLRQYSKYGYIHKQCGNLPLPRAIREKEKRRESETYNISAPWEL